MLVLILSTATAICAAGWLLYWVGAAALVKYMAEKGYKPPSDEEMRACTMYVWKKLLHIR